MPKKRLTNNGTHKSILYPHKHFIGKIYTRHPSESFKCKTF